MPYLTDWVIIRKHSLIVVIYSVDEIQLKAEAVDDPKPLSGLEIIEDDGSMSDDQTDNLAHAQAILDAEDDVPYQFKTDNGGKQI